MAVRNIPDYLRSSIGWCARQWVTVSVIIAEGGQFEIENLCTLFSNQHSVSGFKVRCIIFAARTNAASQSISCIIVCAWPSGKCLCLLIVYFNKTLWSCSKIECELQLTEKKLTAFISFEHSVMERILSSVHANLRLLSKSPLSTLNTLMAIHFWW